MSEKLEKIGIERDRMKQKRDECDRKYRELAKKYAEQESLEITEICRFFSVTPDKLPGILELARKSGAGVSGTGERKENNEDGKD